MILTLAPTTAFSVDLLGPADVPTSQSIELILAPYFKGAKGDDGEFGATAGEQETFVSLTTWSIDHSLARTPHVAVVDEAGRQLLCTIEHVSSTRVTATHNTPQSGTMRIS